MTASQDSYFPEYWEVHVEGRVTNTSEASINVGMVDVRINGVPPTNVTGFVNGYGLRSGEVSNWSADSYLMESSTPPTSATATLEYWSWSGYEFFDCGTDAAR